MNEMEPGVRHVDVLSDGVRSRDPENRVAVREAEGQDEHREQREVRHDPVHRVP